MGAVSNPLSPIQPATRANLVGGLNVIGSAQPRGTPEETAGIAVSALKYAEAQDLFRENPGVRAGPQPQPLAADSRAGQALALFGDGSPPEPASESSNRSLAALLSQQQQQSLSLLYGVNSDAGPQSLLSVIG